MVARGLVEKVRNMPDTGETDHEKFALSLADYFGAQGITLQIPLFKELPLPALDRLGGVNAAVELREPAFWRDARPSSTFQGRDIFAPVAGHLASGVPLDRLGPAVDLLRPFDLPQADGLQGQVVYVDTYGNLVTNVPAESLPERYVVVLDQQRIEPQPHYQAVGPGELLALIGSSGLLEISARDASAAEKTGARRGSRIGIQPA